MPAAHHHDSGQAVEGLGALAQQRGGVGGRTNGREPHGFRRGGDHIGHEGRWPTRRSRRGSSLPSGSTTSPERGMPSMPAFGSPRRHGHIADAELVQQAQRQRRAPLRVAQHGRDRAQADPRMPRGEGQRKGVVHVVADIGVEDERDHAARRPSANAGSPGSGFEVRIIWESHDAGRSTRCADHRLPAAAHHAVRVLQAGAASVRWTRTTVPSRPFTS